MWYTVSVLVQGIHDGAPPVEDLWEERILLLDASDDAEAGAPARTLAEFDSVEYVGISGHRVKWRFAHVGRVCPIDAPVLKSGVEIFSRFLRKPFDESQDDNGRSRLARDPKRVRLHQ